MLEVTNGIKEIVIPSNDSISTSILLCAFLLGFGGISILLQVLAITAKSNISIKPYIIGKLLQGGFASFYTYLVLKHTELFNLDTVPVYYNHLSRLSRPYLFANTYVNDYQGNFLFLFLLIMFVVFLAFRGK